MTTNRMVARIAIHIYYVLTHLSINSKKSFPGTTNSPRHNSHQGPSKVLTVLQHKFEVTRLLVRFCHECSKWVGEPDHQIAHTTHETKFQRRWPRPRKKDGNQDAREMASKKE